MYDIIIIGAGPAALTAAIYSARYNIRTLVIGQILGGLAAEAYKICNFPTYREITGMEFAQKMQEQVNDLGVEIKYDFVTEISKNKNQFSVKTSSADYTARKIILALGTEKRKLNISGEEKYIGKGISYCAVCDAAFYKNKTVAVIGGGNSALTSALLLSEIAKKIYIIYRKEKFFRPDPAWISLVEKNKKIKILFNTNVVELIGTDFLEKIKLNSGKELKIEGLFVEIGAVPNTKLAKSLDINLDKDKYIIVDKNQRTNISGIFAAGDITNQPLKQIITSCAQGAVASQSAYKELIRK